jgi:23S rRNA (cytidine1920-2'-O)/16S rRNA (cytidine1409-2'-O)-methyltransferase
LHLEVIEALSDFLVKNGFIPSPAISSPILGPKGNKEFFILLKLTK